MTNKLDLHLLKFKHVKIIYITPSGQYWGICSKGIKKCIIKKKNMYTNILERFLLDKIVISYTDSKLFKKGEQVSSQNIIKTKGLASVNKKCSGFIMKQLDQFYTTKKNAIICMQLYKKFIKVNKEKDIIIEPSAGCGSFINSINKLCNAKILIDIDPKDKSIQTGNFLEFNMILDKFKKVHVIGNPPFSIVAKFIKKASKVADNIGFILPLSFRKESRKKIFPLHFHCVYEYVLLNNDFYFNDSIRKVPTIFQIWEKRDYNRLPATKIMSKYVKFVKKKDSPTLSFRRVGSKCGELSNLIKDKSESSHYFIQLKNGLSQAKFFEVYTKIKFSHENTVGQKSISQQELLLELKKHGI